MPNKYIFLMFVLALFAFSVLTIPSAISVVNNINHNAKLEKQKNQILDWESGRRHYDRSGKIITGDGGRALGIAQFHRATFNKLKKLAGRPELNIKKKDDQLWLFDWALKNGHAHNWTAARWLAAMETPAFPIKKAHYLVKGSKKCPTHKLVNKQPPSNENKDTGLAEDTSDTPFNAAEVLYKELPVMVINV